MADGNGVGPAPPATPADRRKRKKDGLVVEPLPEGDLMQTPARAKGTKSPWWNAFLEESPNIRGNLAVPSPLVARFSPARPSPARTQSPARHGALFPSSPGSRIWDSGVTPAALRGSPRTSTAAPMEESVAPSSTTHASAPDGTGSSPATRSRRSAAFTFQRAANVTFSVRDTFRSGMDTPSRPIVQRLLFSPGQGRSLAQTPSSHMPHPIDPSFIPSSPLHQYPMEAAASLVLMSDIRSPMGDRGFMPRTQMQPQPPPPPPQSDDDSEEFDRDRDVDQDDDDESDSTGVPVRSSNRRVKKRRLSLDSGGSPPPAPRSSSASDVLPTVVSGSFVAPESLRSPTDARPKHKARKVSKTEPKRCNCKKSKCLKLYCECFQRQGFCKDCNCVGCNNTPEFEDVREKAIQATLERDPHAFFRSGSPRASQAAAVAAAAAAAKPGSHPKGCNCKKSQCLKKYCECFQAGVSCGDNCKCIDCKNGGPHQDLSPNSRKKVKKTGKPIKRENGPPLLMAPPLLHMHQNGVPLNHIHHHAHAQPHHHTGVPAT